MAPDANAMGRLEPVIYGYYNVYRDRISGPYATNDDCKEIAERTTRNFSCIRPTCRVRVRPKVGAQVRVKESVHFAHRFGTVTCLDKVAVHVQFGSAIGIYTLSENTILPLVWRLPASWRCK